MTGSGIQTDPYIVHNWQEYMSVVKTDRYVKWADSDSKVIDFNDIQPDGYKDQSWIIFPYSTDFNGWTLKNLRINSGGIVPQNIRNLNLLDFELPSSEYGFSNAVISKYGTMENCIISGNINSENSVTLLENVDAINCAFNVKITANGSFQLTRRDYSSFMQFRNCDTALDITANEAKLLFSGFSGQCYFKGNFDIKSDAPIIIGTERGNVFDFYSNAEIQYTGNGICIYNSEKLTKTSTSSDNMKPCTEEQLKNAEYLYSIGFPVRTGKETEFALEQGDIFTGFATDNQRTVRTADYIPVSTAYEALTISAVYTKQKSLKPTVKAIGYSSTEISSRTAVSQNTSSVTVNYSALGNSDRIKVNFFRATVYLSQVYQLLPEDVEITIAGNNYQWYIDKNGCIHADDMPYAPARRPTIKVALQRENVIRVYDYREPQDGFKHNGLAILMPSECTSYHELNGRWDVNLTHPVDDWGRWKFLLPQNVLKIHGQLFRIDEHTSVSGTGGIYIQVHAKHIFYDLADEFVHYYQGENLNGYEFIRAMFGACLTDADSYDKYNFQYNSDLDNRTGQIEITDKTLLNTLIGGDDCLVNQLGGELYRNNFYFSVNKRMEGAKNNAFSLKYGFDMTGITQKIDYSDLATWLMVDDNYGNSFAVSYVNDIYPIHHHKHVFKRFNYSTDNSEKLVKDGQELFGQLCRPKVSYEVNIASMKDNPKYSGFFELQNYNLGDSGTVECDLLDIRTMQKIIAIERDELTGNIKKIKLGSENYSLVRPSYKSDTISTGSSPAETALQKQVEELGFREYIQFPIVTSDGKYIATKNTEYLLYKE